MNKSVQVPRIFLNLFPYLILTLEIKHIRHKIQRILVVLHLLLQPGEVEAVRQVLLVDLAKVLVAAGGDELS